MQIRRISGSRQSTSHAIRPQAVGQQASRAPGRLNWPQDRERPDPRSASGAGLTRARARPLPWPHELPDPGFLTSFRVLVQIQGNLTAMGVQVPPAEEPQPRLIIAPPPRNPPAQIAEWAFGCDCCMKLGVALASNSSARLLSRNSCKDQTMSSLRRWDFGSFRPESELLACGISAASGAGESRRRRQR